MKAALPRSITFWSGILVIAFLSWAWWDSLRANSHTGRPSVRMGNAWGGFYVFTKESWLNPYATSERNPADPDWCDLQPAAFPLPIYLRPESIPSDVVDALFDRLYREKHPLFTLREFIELGTSTTKPGGWTLFVPHWLLIAAFALPWSALLLWRTRRRKIKLVAIAPETE